MSLRAKRSNPIPNKINHFEIAASLTLLAMTARIEFFRKLLEWRLVGEGENWTMTLFDTVCQIRFRSGQLGKSEFDITNAVRSGEGINKTKLVESNE